MKYFTVDDANDIVEQANNGDFLNKGKVIDIIKNAARKGLTEVEVKGLPDGIAKSLTSANHRFVVNGDIISWGKPELVSSVD